jgi:integration host factor subunit alpha
MALGKDHLVNRMSSLNGFPKRTASRHLESLLELIKSILESGEPIMISGFGKFQVKDKKNRRGRNPQTGNALILDARRVVTFKCSGVLKQKINKPSKLSDKG